MDSPGRAALAMDVAMLRLQDQQAVGRFAFKPEMRAEIEAQASQGALMLQAGELVDGLCCAVVGLHHDSSQSDARLADLPPERQLARLLALRWISPHAGQDAPLPACFGAG